MLQLRKHQLVINNPTTIDHHASTVLPVDKHHVLVAWFGGSREHNPDVGIWMAEKDDKGFHDPVLIDQTTTAHWNPVLFRCPNGNILLFFKVGSMIANWKTWFVESADQGKTWSDPRELVEGDLSGGRGPVRNKPILLQNGRILAPASVERGVWRCFIDYSDDNALTWQRTACLELDSLHEHEQKLLNWYQYLSLSKGIDLDPAAHIQEWYLEAEKLQLIPQSDAIPEEFRHGRGIIQPTLWQDAKGTVHALMRSSEGSIYKSDSKDNGVHWCNPYPIDMPNNNSGIDLTRLPDGTLLLVYNPVSGNFASRSPISIAVSRDNGMTWEKLLDLENEPGEFSYPAIVSVENHVYLTYTYKRKNIAYWEFDWIP